MKQLWWEKDNVTMTDGDLDFPYAYLEINYSLSNEKMMGKQFV